MSNYPNFQYIVLITLVMCIIGKVIVYKIFKPNNKTNSKMSITIIPQEKKYTQEDLDNARKEGFEAARETRDKGYHPDFEVSGLKKYPTYEAYLKTLESKHDN